MRRILVALDGSPLSETALPLARSLAEAARCELILFSVWETLPEEVETVGPVHARVLRDHGVRYFRAYLHNIAQALQRQGLLVSTEVRAGHPAYEIMLAVSEMDADLLAMASHGRRGVTQRRRGSVADKVLRGSTVPVLIVGPRGPERWPPQEVSLRSILVPLDGSSESEAAMPVASQIARAAGSRITLVRVVPPVLPPFELGLPETYPPDVDRQLAKRAKSYLNRVKNRHPDVVEAAVVERGFPAQVLVQTVEQLQPDLVVMASRSRFAGGHWALGSVADEVIEGLAPVVLVHPAVGA
ncbi:MAG: universal stress protein [Chloroflexi bacterium]|nr:universal stress protein [Chloroflexota bacterium]